MRPERSRMVAGLHGIGNVLAHQCCANRQAPGQGLGQRHDVRCDAVVLITEQGAGPAETGLNLVEHQQHLHLIAQLPQAFNERRFPRMNTALGLEWLQNHRYRLRIHQAFYRLEIVEFRERDSGQQRSEAFVVLRLPRGGNRPHGASVKRVVHCNKLVLCAFLEIRVSPFSRELQRGLPGLRSAIAEKNTIRE